MKNKLSFALVVILAIMFFTQNVLAQEPYVAEELPNLLYLGSIDIRSKLFPYSNPKVVVDFERYWQQYELNIVPVSEAPEFPDYILEEIQNCGAEYMQIGDDYINVFCFAAIDLSEEFGSSVKLENEYFTQSTTAVVSDIEHPYSYQYTFYAPMIGKEQIDGRVVSFGLPYFDAGPYPLLGNIPETAMDYVRGDSYLMWREIADYFSQYLGEEVTMNDLEHVYGLDSFMVEKQGQFWYYPTGTTAALMLNFYAEECVGGDSRPEGMQGYFICNSDFEIDPENPPYFECSSGTPFLKTERDGSLTPYCLHGDINDLPEDQYKIWSEDYHEQNN